MSQFNLLKSIKSWASKAFDVEIPETASDIETMDALNEITVNGDTEISKTITEIKAEIETYKQSTDNLKSEIEKLKTENEKLVKSVTDFKTETKTTVENLKTSVATTISKIDNGDDEDIKTGDDKKDSQKKETELKHWVKPQKLNVL